MMPVPSIRADKTTEWMMISLFKRIIRRSMWMSGRLPVMPFQFSQLLLLKRIKCLSGQSSLTSIARILSKHND
ncbi:hypothetical protein GZ77_18300 [Endozoicomonas montiporae]|uniref:Uncharacterized protein n=1 Tax=Endozoicomonas montiporae TaxID=1027273 RepID=A0A081N200_9GAMM|nr:hypothetical protein GZ77_18300 [Endozoicomonas montiporae]